jgi:hypothetical protein
MVDRNPGLAITKKDLNLRRLDDMAARVITDKHPRSESGEVSEVWKTEMSPMNDFAFCSTTVGSTSRFAGC